MFENYENFDDGQGNSFSSAWASIASECYSFKNQDAAEEFEFISTAVVPDNPVQQALSILGTARIRKDGGVVKATLPEKTYLTVDQPGLKQLYFAKEMSMKVEVGENSIKLSSISGLQGRPPYSPKIGGWVSIKDIEVDRNEARITVGKLGARFTVKIPMDAGAFDEVKELLKKYDIK